MKKSDLLALLDKLNFIVEKSELFYEYHEEFIFCFSEEKRVALIIKEYEEYDGSIVLEDVLKVRLILREHNINIWNSYYLILDTSINKSEQIRTKIYSIERNPRGLRKYVIMSEEDVYRMPFIEVDHSNDPLLNFESDLDNVFQSTDQEVAELLKWILESEGDIKEINKREIKDKVNHIFVRGD